ncbi:keratin-associated protein 21-1-like, partial [Phoca vitulina]
SGSGCGYGSGWGCGRGSCCGCGYGSGSGCCGYRPFCYRRCYSSCC